MNSSGQVTGVNVVRPSYAGSGGDWFDRYLHAYGSFSFALLFFYLLDHFLIMDGSPLFLAVFVFLLGNTVGVIFELLEFNYDLKPTNTIKAQHGLKDTDTDMLFNLFGAIGAAIFIYFTA